MLKSSDHNRGRDLFSWLSPTAFASRPNIKAREVLPPQARSWNRLTRFGCSKDIEYLIRAKSRLRGSRRLERN